jgi:hypothetical protein
MRGVVDCVLAALVAAGLSLACTPGPSDNAAVAPLPDSAAMPASVEPAKFTLAARRSALQGLGGPPRLDALLPVHLGEPWLQARQKLLQVGSECSDWATPEETFVECKIKPDKDQVLDGFYWCRAGSVDGTTVNRINVSAAR